MYNSLGQCVSFCHQCTAADSSDSRRTPTQRVNEHLHSVQRVTRIQSCDTSLLWFEVLSCSCSWQELASLISSRRVHRPKKNLEKIDATRWCRCCILYNFYCNHASLEHKLFQTCFESLRYSMRDQVVFALRSNRETVWRISRGVLLLL